MDSCPRGRGFESHHILDECKRCYLLYIQWKIKIMKVAKWGTPKNIFSKETCDDKSNLFCKVGNLVFLTISCIKVECHKHLLRANLRRHQNFSFDICGLNYDFCGVPTVIFPTKQFCYQVTPNFFIRGQLVVFFWW